MQIKLIIWDLDDTLWQGTLADGDDVVLNVRRAALVRAFNARGVVSSICSNNDPEAAEARLRGLGLWDEFVFPRIAFAPKPEAIRQIIADMQLRPVNVLFVDDNPHVLAGAKHALPELNTLDALAPETDATLEALLTAQPANAKSRLEQYRILERKTADRKVGAQSQEDFLLQCDIRVSTAYWMDNLDFAERIAELVNRSNQLNYTGSRFELPALKEAIIDVSTYNSWSIFAWDRYGDYGLVGFMVMDRRTMRLTHFAFSCRIMHMGIERFALNMLLSRYPQCDVSVLDGQVTPGEVPWIREMPFNDPGVRERLVALAGRTYAGAADVRVMFDCQSGGIAHFSRHRDRIDFDNNPRVFYLRHLIPGNAGETPSFPRHLVYGAGTDYSDSRWPDLVDLIDDGLFEACVELLCARVTEEDRRMLVILPGEDAPETFYPKRAGPSRNRTQRFNTVWRQVAASCPAIDVLEMTGFAQPEDMAHVNHYYAHFLNRLAGVVDDWIDASEESARLVRAA